MSYNPEHIEGKRPMGGEIWIDRATLLRPVLVEARRTVSTLYALGRRDKLSECEDLQSMVLWITIDGKGMGITHEKEFCDIHAYVGKHERGKARQKVTKTVPKSDQNHVMHTIGLVERRQEWVLPEDVSDASGMSLEYVEHIMATLHEDGKLSRTGQNPFRYKKPLP